MIHDMGDDYVLARGYRSSARLNLQHYAIKEALGFLLHPVIPIPKDQWKVADVGTGTGIWISELSKIAPNSSSLDGFDISSDQFPHPSTLPGKISLSILDAEKLPPEHLWGVYDVVHARLLGSIIKDNDATPVLKHCLKLLKPGGYLQWDEMDLNAVQPLPHSPDFSTPYLDALEKVSRATRPTDWIPNLPTTFEQNGLDIAAAETFHDHQSQRQIMMEIWCLTADDFATMAEIKGDFEKADEFRKTASGAYEEIKKGAQYMHVWNVTVGKVPSDKSI